MIVFEQIRWKNFLATGNSWITVDLNRNTHTLIVGKNGSGKSTVLDALTFSLFGKPFRKINKPSLINSVNGGETLVEIKFRIGSKNHIVRRGIKPNVFEIEIDGEELDQSANVRDFQEYFEQQILRLNYKSFTQAVILGSATFLPFMQLPAAHRREVIEDLLDIQVFSAMNLLLKQKIVEIKDELEDNQRSISLAEERMYLHQQHLEKLKTDHKKQIEDNRTKIEESLYQIQTHQNQIQELLANLEALQKTIADEKKTAKTKKKAEDLHSKIVSNVNKLQKEINFYESHDECPVCEQEIETSFKQQMMEDKTGRVEEIDKALKELESKIGDATDRLDAIAKVSKEISDTQSAISQNENSVSALEQYIKKVQSEVMDLQMTKSDVKKEQLELEGLEEKSQELETKKESLANTKEIHDVATGLLKDTGIKTLIVKQYIPVINKLVNKYLADMDFFVNFTLDDNFNEKIKSRYRDEFSYFSFSEGEKKRIDLALLFTWRAVAKLKNSINTNLLILDEVFDSSLDGEGTEEFMKILYSLGGDQNVFVISHKSDVLQDKFVGYMKFEKVKGFSRVEQ